ncbi:MAG: efflux transporter periplasmic adaptor subunit, partial [Azorhizobium sp. 39-67-5]
MDMLQKSGNGDIAKPVKARKGRARKAWIFALLLGAAGAGGYYVYAQGPAPAAAQMATAPVVRGDLEQNVTALGTIKPKTYVDVGTQVSGQLRKVLVEIGDTVKKGDLLAQIDPTVYQTRVIGDQAQLENLKAQL